MDGMGARMKARARELGLSDTKVAERAGLSQTRYATYTLDKFEPDLATLLRICRVLQVTPNSLLGWNNEVDTSSASKIQSKLIADILELRPELLKAFEEIVKSLK